MPTGEVKTFELTVPISGALDVPFEDWPAEIQDGLYAALERLSHQEQLPLAIVHAQYGRDYDLSPNQVGYHYLHVIASEVVAADVRNIDPRRIIGELPEDIRRLLN